MKLYTRILAFIACSVAIFSACDDDTATIGSSVMPMQDSLSTFYETYPLTTRSVLTGPVVANTSSCYLGSFIDPETNAVTTSSFLAQFHLQEDYTLPDEKLVFRGDDGKVIADSCVIRIFHDKYYGDSLATMKLTATDLRLDNVMEEGRTYYTDINPLDYVNPTPKVKASTTYTIIDQNLKEIETALSSGNYRSIPIHLGAEYGTYILRNYYEHPEYFRNSYSFAHNVCPGFYIQHTGGVGALVNADVSSLDVYFRYQENDTTVTKAWMRLGATQEVIQNTSISHSNLSTLFDADGYAYDHLGKPFTYIKSPAGIHTEITLPVKDIAFGKLDKNGDFIHENDTLNSARFTLRRYVAEQQNSSRLTPPPYLLLVRKSQMDKFFANNMLPDNETSFLCEFSKTNNAYSFSNIAPLITYLRKQRDHESGILSTDNSEQREEKWEKWETENPDWNKVVLLPVNADYTTVQNYLNTSKVLVGVRNDYSLRSVRLEGCIDNNDGTHNGDLMLNVIYSRFTK